MAAREQTTQLVGDVRTLKDHIACSHETRSEIVIPICSKTKTMAVLDVDSNRKDAFDEIDKKKLEDICDFLSRKFFC